MRLQGKVAIVSGGGRGIGAAIARAFAREGADVAIAARTVDEIEGTATAIREMGQRAIAVPTDVAVRAEVEHLVHRTLSELGSVDILVNDAGILGPVGPMADNDVEEWIDCIRINLIGVYLLTRMVLPLMLRRRAGKIINLSGGGAAGPRERFTSYSASKAAVVRLTECLAHELKDYNIQVNAMAPGLCNTRMFEQIVAAGDRAGKAAMAEVRERLRTGGTPLELPAQLAVCLASDESNWLTGRLISATYDDWRGIADKAKAIMGSDAYTLRRIDTHTLRRIDPSWRLPGE